MRNTQAKTIAIIDAMASERGLELVHNPQLANTGRLIIEPPMSFNPLATIRYSFQSGYSTFEFTPRNFIQGLTDGNLHYVLDSELQSRLIEPLRRALAGLDLSKEGS